MHGYPHRRSVCILFAMLSIAHAGASLEDQALAAMKKATATFTDTVSTRGGYLWRYSEDLTRREGEGKATAEQVWVQPPGTPAVGLAYVRAYEAAGDKQFLDAAVAAADALMFGQLWSGGWQYSIHFGDQGKRRHAYRHLQRPKSKMIRAYSILDDNTTQAALRCLMAVDRLTKNEKVHEAAMYGLNALLKAQLPKGGWPQIFGQPIPEQKYGPYVKIGLDGTRTTLQRPVRYNHYYTFNDNAMNDCIAVCLEAHVQYKDKRFLDAVRKAGDFIILSQLKAPQAGWAQQYTLDLQPEWARKFEPKSVCSAVTYRNILTLINICRATGDEKYLKPIPAALDWLQRSPLPGKPTRYARFYELGSNRPLYFTKDKYELTYKADNLPTHYAFIVTGEYYARGKAAYERASQPLPPKKPRKANAMEREVRRVIAALDKKSLWLDEGWIECRTFIKNLHTLADYVEACRAENAPKEVQIKSAKDGAMQPAQFYAPTGGEPAPLVVALHTWSADYRQKTPWNAILATCRERGWAAIHANFRGPNRQPEACGSDLAVQDVLDAVAYAREHARVDPSRVWLVGVSGGGHMAMLMAGRAPKVWAGVSAWVGISDLAAWHSECKTANRRYYRDIEGACGGPPAPGTRIEYRRRSPIHHLSAAKGLPVDLNAGIHDGHTGSVPVSHTLRAFNVLAEANGLPSKTLTDEQIAFTVANRRVPEALTAEREDDAARRRKVLFRRAAGPARVTLFDGGHEIDVPAALAWLEGQARGEGVIPKLQ